MAYLGRPGATAPLTSADIPDNSITGAKIVAGTIEASDVAADMATQAELDALGVNKIETNIALLAFKTAVNGSLAKYNLQDQIIDEFEDATGINTGDSTNEVLAGGAYRGRTGSGESISATGGTRGTQSTGGAGGTGTGGTSQGTGGTGSDGSSVASDDGGAGTTAAGSGAVGAGGGSGGSDANQAGAGGAGNAASYTGGGGAGASDNNTVNVSPLPAGGAGYSAGGTGSDNNTGATAGAGIGGSGSTYGGGDAGQEGSTRKNNGAGGGWPGGGGGGLADYTSGGSTKMSSGSGAAGGVIITYTNSGAQVVTKISGTDATYDVPGGSTDLIVYAVGGGGAGGNTLSHDDNSICGGGGGGGVAKSNTFADAVRTVTYSVGTAGLHKVGHGTLTPEANGGATTVTIGGTSADLILQSTDTAAEAQPTKADMVMLIEDAGSGVATLGTHIKGFISRDSGTTFTEGTLVDEGHWGDGATAKRILAFHDLDIDSASQPDGTAMCYKITTHSTSAVYDTKIHATSIGWR
jgi:hypothetical protein